ncbi:MAG TPA: hypothetical protein VGM98_16615 [Schlesneria sp.]|jgi:hypothetical protein
MNSVLAEITWRPRIGDANALAWCITASYFIASFICVLVVRRQRGTGSGRDVRQSRYWLILAATLFALGWNKQLDLQILLTQIGRELSRSGGWYDQRRAIQAAFAISCAVLGVVGAVAGLRAVWGQNFPAYVACLGVIFLLTFIAIRAASFHHIDTLLYRHPMLGNWLNTCLESGGIMLVAFGGVLALRTSRVSE